MIGRLQYAGVSLMSIKTGVGLMEGVIGLMEDNHAEQHIYSLPAQFRVTHGRGANRRPLRPK